MSSQIRVNTELWIRGAFVPEFANRDLRPAEVLILVRYREALSGRVLEIGCGAGRVSGYLAQIAEEMHGVDVAEPMVEYCRRTYPRGHFSRQDMRDLSIFEDGRFDVVFPTFNVLDVLDDAERRRVLGELHRIIAPDGLLILSTHNRAFAPRLPRPTKWLARRPSRVLHHLWRIPRRVRNHRRLAPLQMETPGYAIINDEAHDFAVLHYWIDRDTQEVQLREHGFELIECLDLPGEVVAAGESGAGSGQLHYIARRV